MCEEFGIRVVIILVVTGIGRYRCAERCTLETLRGLEVISAEAICPTIRSWNP
jgi:hypothetical protein